MDEHILHSQEPPEEPREEPEEFFDGFTPPVDDYFRMPNQWINISAKITNIAELKVVQYVLRHTWGYQDYDGVRKITVEEFMFGRKRRDKTRIDEGTGLSEQSVKDGIKRALRHGYIICEIDDKDLGRIKKYYGLKILPHPDSGQGARFLPPKSDEKNRGLEPCPQRARTLPPGGQNLAPRRIDSSPRSEKDTSERQVMKDITESVCGNPPDGPPPDDGANAPTHALAILSDFSEDEETLNATTKRPAVQLPVPPLAEEEPPPVEGAETDEASWDGPACEALLDQWRGIPLLDAAARRSQAAYAEQIVTVYSRELLTCLRTAMLNSKQRDRYFADRGVIEAVDVIKQGHKWIEAARSLLEQQQASQAQPGEYTPLPVGDQPVGGKEYTTVVVSSSSSFPEGWQGKLPMDSPLYARRRERERQQAQQAQQAQQQQHGGNVPPLPLPGVDARLVEEMAYVREQMEKMRAGMRLTPTSRGIILKKLLKLAGSGVTGLATGEELAALQSEQEQGELRIVESSASVLR